MFIGIPLISLDGLLPTECIWHQHSLDLSSPLATKILSSLPLPFRSSVEEDEVEDYGNAESRVEGVGIVSVLS